MTAPDFPAARVAPHNPEAEIAVLGSILLDSDTFHGEQMSLLHPAKFYRQGNGLIFAAIQHLIEVGTPPDLVTLNAELTARGELDRVGGLTYLIGLQAEVPTSAYAEHYAAIVHEAWIRRELIRQSAGLSRMAYEGQHDLEDVLQEATRIGTGLDLALSRGSYSADEVMTALIGRIMAGNGEKPLPIGFTDLDRKMGGGLFRASLNIIGARPSMGKTAFALNIALNGAVAIAQSGENAQVGIISLEMSRDALGVRLLATEARINPYRLKDAMQGEAVLSAHDWERTERAAKRIAGLPITMFDDANEDANINMLTAKLRAKHKITPFRLILVDYLQLMTVGGRAGGENRVQEVSTISRKLKLLARELNCPVIALSQLSRAVEQRPNHRPMLSDLRESGAVEQDADLVMFIYRDEYYNPETDQQGVAEIIIGKQRDGEIGTVKLQYHAAHVRFNDLAE